MAVGLPVIATKTGENPQIVEEGTSGFLVQPGQPEELAEATIRLYDTNKRKRIGRISMKKIEGYDWKIIAKKALKEYERLTT
jgi:glycosyltransferase involved in cell wall biosynthesis